MCPCPVAEAEGIARVCTVTWLRHGRGYRLWFNRDELKTRAEALPPRRSQAEGVLYVAPVDPDGGGTWIATSELGLTVAVLNGNRRADEAPRPWRSRGELPARLVAGAGPDEVLDRLAASDLSDFRSFRLLALDDPRGAHVAEWDGRELVLDRDAERRVPLVSSAFDESAVGAARRAEYARLVGASPTPERLLAFHRSAAGGPSAFTVAMERPEAATRSLTRVTVTGEEVRHEYEAGRPDRARVPVIVTIPRRTFPR